MPRLDQLLLVAAVLLFVSCNPNTPPTQSPTSTVPHVTASPGAGGGETVSAAPCEPVQALTTAPEEVVASLPLPPFGAGDEEDELNPGRDPPTPVNPDAVIDADSDLVPSEIPVPPIGAQEQPEDVIAYRDATAVAGASQKAEPNVAIDGQSAFMTWNWGAARSSDGGVHYELINPYAQFASGEDGGFCCDQLAHHDQARGLWFWVLQSRTPVDEVKNHSGGNRIRVKVAKGDGAFLTAFDFKSSSAGLAGDVWFDQPKIATSAQYLYLSVNAYLPNEENVASVVYRAPLDAMANGQSITPNCFTTLHQLDAYSSPLFAPTPVRIAADTMYIAAHYDNSKLAIWRWPDGSAQPTFHLVSTSYQGDGAAYQYTQGAYKCLTDGVTDVETNWCANSTDRVASAWMSGSKLGFAWNIGQDPANGWPYPSVWVVLLDANGLDGCANGECIVAKPKIRSQKTAFQWPAIVPDSRGDLGAVALLGGGAYKQSCVMAVRAADATDPTGGWEWSSDYYTSDRDAVAPKSGDYLNIWPGSAEGTWNGSCMVDQASNASLQSPSTVVYPFFGRRSDFPTP